jgi:NAD(P)-dependent dehydrogenase (short-subunit alcohol dehydrogenase family)
MKINLKKKTILITGGTGALGKKICECFAKNGADLIILDRKDSKKYCESLERKYSIKTLAFKIDFLDKTKPYDELFNQIQNKFKKIDVLINNAAFVGDEKLDGWNTKFENQTVESWRKAIEVNLTSIFELVKVTKKLFNVKKNTSSIINISSIYGNIGPNYNLYKNTPINNPAAYAVSKSGLNQLTRWLASTLAPSIRVNAVAIGGIKRNQPLNFINKYEQLTPLRRMAKEDDVLGILLLLSSDYSNYITGQTITVDGGFSII